MASIASPAIFHRWLTTVPIIRRIRRVVKVGSREQSPQTMRFHHAFDALDHRGLPHGNLFLTAPVAHLRVGVAQNAEQTVHDLGFAPVQALQVLHPLKVRHHHAAGVAKNIRNHENFRALPQNGIRFRGGGPIGALGQDAALQFPGVGRSDLPRQRRRHQNVARSNNS